MHASALDKGSHKEWCCKKPVAEKPRASGNLKLRDSLCSASRSVLREEWERFFCKMLLIFCVCEEAAGLISKRLFMGAFALVFTPSPQLTVSAACCSSYTSPEDCRIWGVPALAPLLLLPPDTDPITVLLPEAGIQPTCKSSVGLFFLVVFFSNV